MSNDNDGHHEQPVDQPSPDLTYLHPDNLHIGQIGVFAGDWAWTGEPPRIPVGFVGVLIDYWNGWAVWRCTRQVAEAVVADQQRLRDTERARLTESGTTGAALDEAVDENVSPVWFDGDDLVLDESARFGEPGVDRQSPGDDGRYCPMGFNWTWIVVDPADCDRIAGVLPTFGEHREFAMATHQPLRMPHDRLTVTRLYAAPPGDRIDYAAELCLDGKVIGTAAITRAGDVAFHPLSRAFTGADLDTFVKACRWRGRETSITTVLHALVGEFKIARHLAEAEAKGLGAVVLRDGDDHVLATKYLLDRRQFDAGGLQELAEHLTVLEAGNHRGQDQFVWQFWTGTRWELVGVVDVPRDNRTGTR